jgi:diguanylate cyclase (GGDEF)-like protein
MQGPDNSLIAQLLETVVRLEQSNAELSACCARLEEEREHAWYRAMRDPLTHLPNRALFEDRLELTMKRAWRAGQHFAVAYLDLDGFKPLNDRHGHAAGDEMLVNVARRLEQALRDTDTIARFGGDEFALLLEDLDGAGALDFLSERVLRQVCAPLVLEATLDGVPAVVCPHVSIGIALFPDHAASREELLRRADGAMYAAKREGGGVRLGEGPGERQRAQA